MFFNILLCINEIFWFLFLFYAVSVQTFWGYICVIYAAEGEALV